jgi:hypothetical protein
LLQLILVEGLHAAAVAHSPTNVSREKFVLSSSAHEQGNALRLINK